MMEADRAKLRQDRESLKNLWSAEPAAPDEQPRAPDVFADERAGGDRRRAALSSVFQDDLEAQARERESLQNMFGSPKKPRR